MPKMLTKHFSLEELTLSETAARKGIDNTPGPTELRNLKRLAQTLEKLRSALGNKPIVVTSGYRSPALNAAIGGSKNSRHMLGLAVDFISPGFGTVLQTARTVVGCGVEFDQTIYEYGDWLHFGLSPNGQTPRGEVLSIGSKNEYVPGLTNNC
jgi:zinc D-Ala-D-Ala carboxypeptidase